MSASTKPLPPTITKPPTPVTVFTGFLGAGKTTIILSLLKRLPPSYNVVLLKNEFGDVKVDSELATENNIKVTEMLNGCLCCVLVGQMKVALLEIKEKFNPDRIIIETSGSAFPAPIAWQIRQIADEGFTLDGIITVIDCVNFTGYEDTSYTARMQAKYTDIILLNKHELITERQLDTVLDHVYELNEDTPKIKCEGLTGVSPDLVFGIDTQLFQINAKAEGGTHGSLELLGDPNHHENEVDIVQIMLGGAEEVAHAGSESCDHPHHHHQDHDHKSHNTTTESANSEPCQVPTRESISAVLESLPKDNIYRVKGFIRVKSSTESNSDTSLVIVNWAFGRFTLTDITQSKASLEGVMLKLTVMGVELKGRLKTLAEGFRVPVEGLKFIASSR
ncbi:hypothetical protein HDU76_012405 [Blyttiomyces sp. JEL0837]|nr:hypothetical protein HDU76_012405 [Blyttiomyces sp. JEL0837]